ncbi:MAG: hypothetical protein GSR85_07895 [Desulfurococcales archaeon]|nr:hypothetical protein [Desulfurococcales archaeon]
MALNESKSLKELLSEYGILDYLIIESKIGEVKKTTYYTPYFYLLPPTPRYLTIFYTSLYNALGKDSDAIKAANIIHEFVRRFKYIIRPYYKEILEKKQPPSKILISLSLEASEIFKIEIVNQPLSEALSIDNCERDESCLEDAMKNDIELYEGLERGVIKLTDLYEILSIREGIIAKHPFIVISNDSTTNTIIHVSSSSLLHIWLASLLIEYSLKDKLKFRGRLGEDIREVIKPPNRCVTDAQYFSELLIISIISIFLAISIITNKNINNKYILNYIKELNNINISNIIEIIDKKIKERELYNRNKKSNFKIFYEELCKLNNINENDLRKSIRKNIINNIKNIKNQFISHELIESVKNVGIDPVISLIDDVKDYIEKSNILGEYNYIKLVSIVSLELLKEVLK